MFDDTTKQLVGILVRGEDDYVPDQGAGCSRVNVCPDAGCTGEESTYAFRALEALCASGQGGDFACECGDGTCDGDETQGGCCIDCGCPGAADQCVVGHCASPAQPGDTCDQPLEIAAEGTQTITGDTFLAGDDLAGGCDVGEAPDRVYTFTLAGPTAVDAQAGGYDTGLYLRTDCADVSTEVACNDDIVLGEDRGSHITATLSAGTYYLVVDGFDAAGAYTLTVTFEPTGCPDRDGDGVCDVDDACADDPEKSQPGECGCGVADSDTDSDATADCADPCPDDPDDECAAGDGGGGGGCSTAPGPGGSGSPGLILLALGLAALCLRLPERTGTKKIAGSRPARMLTNVGGGGSSMGCSGQRRGEGAMLRYRADRQTVLYMITATALLFWQWSRPEFSAPLFVWACFMAVTITVIAHNHNHLGMWRSRTGNFLTDYWLTLLYGFPAFAWIPTHNQNHHKFNNREGDYTITYRYSERNNLVTLLTYPTVSGYHQQKPIRDHLRHLWATRRRRFWFSISQYGLLVLLIGGGLLLDWRKALLYIVVPQQFGLFMVLVFNYLQHVHADEESEFNHSRNLVGRALNFFLLNNGYHTVHHESPGTHWSRLPEAHAAIADRIDPRLNERSFWWMMVRMFLLSPFVPRLRSRSLRLERIAGLSASRARAA